MYVMYDNINYPRRQNSLGYILPDGLTWYLKIKNFKFEIFKQIKIII